MLCKWFVKRRTRGGKASPAEAAAKGSGHLTELKTRIPPLRIGALQWVKEWSASWRRAACGERVGNAGAARQRVWSGRWVHLAPRHRYDTDRAAQQWRRTRRQHAVSDEPEQRKSGGAIANPTRAAVPRCERRGRLGVSAWSMGKGDKKGKGGKGKGGKKKGKGKKSREKNTEGTSFEVEQDDAGEAGEEKDFETPNPYRSSSADLENDSEAGSPAAEA